MRNLKVTRSSQVECNLSADQWQLYADQPDGPEGGRDLAAQELNAAFVAAVGEGKNVAEIWAAMAPVMKKWDTLGACDSEGYHTVEDLIDAALGTGGLS